MAFSFSLVVASCGRFPLRGYVNHALFFRLCQAKIREMRGKESSFFMGVADRQVDEVDEVDPVDAHRPPPPPPQSAMRFLQTKD